MDITIHEQSDTLLQFTLSGVSAAYANTLRRLMLGEVPTMAIEEVKFFKNDSVLYDEIVAHRLGLVVLTTDLANYNMTSVCPCNGAGCPQCQLTLTLSVEGPKTVYAKDLVSKDPSVTPVYGDTIIVKLLEGQSLELEATAMLGTGKEHSKWTPGLMWYRKEPVIKVNNKAKDFADFKDKYPPQVFDDKGAIDANKITSASLVDACIDVNPDIVLITFKDDSYIFTVESYGALAAKEIVEQAVAVFEAQVNTFEGLVKAL